MGYAILLILGGFLAAMGFRANELNKQIREMLEADAAGEEQRAVWHEMGGFNLLLLTYGPNTLLSLAGGAGLFAAYIGLWRCALGKWSGLVMVILGAGVCAAVQYTMIARVKADFARQEKETGENPAQYFTGKDSLSYAVYTSVMIGAGKIVKFILIVSIVGIMLYGILKRAVLSNLDLEERIIRGDFQFPPKVIYDEVEAPWRCTAKLGEDGHIKVYTPITQKTLWGPSQQPAVYIDSNKLDGLESKITHIIVGDRTFHW